VFIFKSGPNGSFPLTADYFIIDTLVETPEIHSDDMRIYPNPSQGNFIFNSGSQQAKNICIYDALGHLIFESNLIDNEVIDLTSFHDGFYYAKIEDVMIKLVKVSN